MPDDETASNGPGSKLWSQLPKPAGPSASTTGLSALPPPAGKARGGGRKVVTLPLPFSKELLAVALDSDDEDEPAAKRVKTTGAKSCLMDFLPPPKYNTGSALPRAALGSGAASRPTSAPGKAAEPMGQAAEGALPANFFSGRDSEPYGNEAYRVADGDQGAAAGADAGVSYPGHNVADATAASYYGSASDQSGTYDHTAYYAQGYGPGPCAELPPPSFGPTAAGGAAAAGGLGAATAGPEDLIGEALRAEQERASKRGGGGNGGVKLIEINAKDLTRMDPAAREAANSARDALGPEYALALRRSAAPFEGSKMARRKHQIGTLLFSARMQELEQMEKRTQGQKSKAETAAKYGW